MLILWSFFAALAAVFQFKRVSPLRFDYFSTLIWLVSLSINFFGLVAYPPLTATTIWFVVGCHLALIAGYNLVGAKSGGSYTFAGELGIRAQVLAVLTLAFVVLVAGRVVTEGQVPFVGALSRLQDARAEHWERGGENAYVMDQIIRIFSYGATAYLMIVPLIWRQWKDLPKLRRGGLIPYVLLAVVSGALMVDQALRDGGRALIVYLLLGGGAIYLVIFPLNLRRGLLISIGGFALAFFLIVNFYQYRNQNFSSNPRYYIERVCAGSPPAAFVIRGSDALQAATVSSCYFTSPVHNLDAFLINNDQLWDHTYGLYSLSVFIPDSFLKIRDELAWYYRLLGEARNPWATAARDYWLDWSWWAVLAFVVTGIVFGWLSRKRVLRTETDLARFGLIVIAAFFIPFQSPLINRPMLYPIVVTILVDILAAGIAPGRSRSLVRRGSKRLARGGRGP